MLVPVVHLATNDPVKHGKHSTWNKYYEVWLHLSGEDDYAWYGIKVKQKNSSSAMDGHWTFKKDSMRIVDWK